MMNHGIRVSLPFSLLACSLLAIASAPSSAQAGHVNFLLGSKVLEEADWAPADNQPALGMEASWGGPNWPVMIATDLLGSRKSKSQGGSDYKSSTGEMGLGVRKVWNSGTQGRVHPYIGGGLAFASGTAEVTTAGVTTKNDDSGVGAWIGGGIFWRLGSRFNLGMSLRGTSAKVSIAGVDANAGGGTFGLILGWGWPKADR